MKTKHKCWIVWDSANNGESLISNVPITKEQAIEEIASSFKTFGNLHAKPLPDSAAHSTNTEIVESRGLVEMSTNPDTTPILRGRKLIRRNPSRKMQVGSVFTHPTLGNVKIVKLHPAGTVDVKNASDRYYRISGLPMDSYEPPKRNPSTTRSVDSLSMLNPLRVGDTLELEGPEGSHLWTVGQSHYGWNLYRRTADGNRQVHKNIHDIRGMDDFIGAILEWSNGYR